MRIGSFVRFYGFKGRVDAIYKHPDTGTDVAVVNFADAMRTDNLPGFVIEERDCRGDLFQWDGSALPIAMVHLEEI